MSTAAADASAGGRRADAGGARRWLVALGGPLLLAAHTLAFSHTVDFAGLDAWRRMWSDLAIATASFVDAVHGPPPDEGAAQGRAADVRARSLLLERIERDGLRATRPLGIVNHRPFMRERLAPEPHHYDDKGRAALLGLAFRLRGGIAPFLILWLGWLAATPVLVWTSLELWTAGRIRSAAAFPLLLGVSPFVTEALALARYPVAFYVVGLLLVVPLAVYARLHPTPTLRGLAIRAVAASLALALCVFCRSSAALLLPGFVLACALGIRRLVPRASHRWAATAAAAVLFALPSPFVQRSQQNDLWQPLWEGLGDFDREKGYTWNDSAAKAAARREGAPALWTAESEGVFRTQILRDVRQDPAWFAGILLRRFGATVTLWKLWPWGPWSGSFIRHKTTPNEGVIDKYWTYTTTIDHLGFGPAQAEVPVPVLLAPAAVLGLMAFRGRRRSEARLLIAVLACPALAALTLPVLITTAGGQETQAFGLAYLLAAAFLMDTATKS